MPKSAAPSGIKINGIKIEHLDKKTLVSVLVRLINKHEAKRIDYNKKGASNQPAPLNPKL